MGKTGADGWTADEDKPATVVAPPPLPAGPAAGMADVRIASPSQVHYLVITQYNIKLARDSWLSVPQEQVAEITQIAAENQVLLETREVSA